jgi:hypothetical protein
MSLLKVNTIRNRTGSGSPEFDYGINVISGISTVSGVKIQTGVVTSFSQAGIVTYYGDGVGLSNIPNSALQNSTISGKSLGSNLSNLTAGSYITSGGTYNGSTARTFAVDATSSNTASKVVARDSNGDFSSRYITATQFIKSGGSSSQFLKADGSVDSNSYITSSSIGNGTLTIANGTGISLSASPSFTANQSANKTITISTNATSSNTASTIVSRGASGEFTAGAITVSSVSSSGSVTASGFVISGQSGFLKANGTVDTNSYLTSASIGDGTLTISVSGSGLGISATPTFTANQSGNKTITVSSNGTSANTASTLVFRDGSGNFSSNIITAVTFNSTSDITLKKDIYNVDNALDKISNLNGVNFTWKESNLKSMGVIAQNVETVAPELVYDSNGIKTVNYDGLIAILIESIKELKMEIETLKNN